MEELSGGGRDAGMLKQCNRGFCYVLIGLPIMKDDLERFIRYSSLLYSMSLVFVDGKIDGSLHGRTKTNGLFVNGP